MRLEIGKRYITRDGKVTGQMEYHTREFRSWCTTLRLGEDDIPFSWEDINGCLFNHHATPYDLVSEYTEKEKPMFKVGDKVYETGPQNVFTILCIHKNEAWIVGKIKSRLVNLNQLTLVPEPSYIRKSVSELMAEGWVFDVHGALRITEDGEQYIIGSVYLLLLGTENDSRFFDRSVYPNLWKEMK